MIWVLGVSQVIPTGCQPYLWAAWWTAKHTRKASWPESPFVEELASPSPTVATVTAIKVPLRGWHTQQIWSLEDGSLSGFELVVEPDLVGRLHHFEPGAD